MKNSTCPVGYTGPGGLTNNSYNYECLGGNFKAIDLYLLGQNRMYKWTPARNVFFPDSISGNGNAPKNSPLYFEVEGHLSTLQAIITCFLGLQAGKIFKHFKTDRGRVGRFLAWSILCFVIFGFTQISIPGKSNSSHSVFPIKINKQIWSISYCYLTASISFLFLSFFYHLTERSRQDNRHTKIKFFNSDTHFIELRFPFNILQICGKNPLAIYVLHCVFRKNVLFNYGMAGTTTEATHEVNQFLLLASNVFGTVFWIGMAWIMDKYGIYLRI